MEVPSMDAPWSYVYLDKGESDKLSDTGTPRKRDFEFGFAKALTDQVIEAKWESEVGWRRVLGFDRLLRWRRPR